MAPLQKASEKTGAFLVFRAVCASLVKQLVIRQQITKKLIHYLEGKEDLDFQKIVILATR